MLFDSGKHSTNTRYNRRYSILMFAFIEPGPIIFCSRPSSGVKVVGVEVNFFHVRLRIEVWEKQSISRYHCIECINCFFLVLHRV